LLAAALRALLLRAPCWCAGRCQQQGRQQQQQQQQRQQGLVEEQSLHLLQALIFVAW
jgi:hypothetical protein